MVAEPAGGGALRRAGYRLLGPGFDYLLHLRPAEWPIMAAHTALGYLLAVGVSGALHGKRLGPALLGLGVWVVLLNGGTLAINSAFDRDQGDIGYLRNPPPAPRYLGWFALALMGAGQVVALRISPGYAWVYGICFAMSLLYSVPPVRLKAVAGMDWLINMWGFGTLTPYAGYAATGHLLAPAHGLVLLAFCPLFASLYPLTQLYQFEEDRGRGDRTFALILGMKRSLQLSLFAAAVAFTIFVAAGVASGWGFQGGDLARWTGLALAAAAWARVLVPWLRRWRELGPAAHQAGMYAALRAWAITDLVVILGWGLYT